MAFKAGLFQESESFIEICRAENPPKWIENELQEISNLIQTSKEKTENKTLQLNGIFKEVNSQKNEIIIEDLNNNEQFTLIVPRAVLIKIIKKHLAKRVKVLAQEKPYGVMVLQEISAAA